MFNRKDRYFVKDLLHEDTRLIQKERYSMKDLLHEDKCFINPFLEHNYNQRNISLH